MLSSSHALANSIQVKGLCRTGTASVLSLRAALHRPITSATEEQGRDERSELEKQLTHTSFSPDVIASSLAELASWKQHQVEAKQGVNGGEADFMSLEQPNTPAPSGTSALTSENAHLRQQMAALRRVEKANFAQIEALRMERKELLGKAKKGMDRQMDTEMKDLEDAEEEWSKLGREGSVARSGKRRRVERADNDVDEGH